MTPDTFAEVFVTTLVKAIEGPRVGGRFEALTERLAQLEAEVSALKARPLQKWAGIHVEGMQYAEASLVSRQGSLRVSTAATTTTPGAEASDWRLIVKRGNA